MCNRHSLVETLRELLALIPRKGHYVITLRAEKKRGRATYISS